MKKGNNVFVGAIIVSYNPELPNLQDNINSIYSQVDFVIVVDNGSANQEEISALKTIFPHLLLICNQENGGIAKALNQGMLYLESKGIQYAITLDQDSKCSGGMIDTLVATFSKFPNAGLICPSIWYVGWRKQKFMQSKTCEKIQACMTSASLTKVEAWRKVGGFNEDYFIDFVDNEFCIKLRIAGFEIVRNNSVVLYHHLGNAVTKRFLFRKVTYTHHSSWRYYYMIRNNYSFIRTYKEEIQLFKEILKLVSIILSALIFENDKFDVFNQMRKGMRDAKKKMGSSRRFIISNIVLL